MISSKHVIFAIVTAAILMPTSAATLSPFDFIATYTIDPLAGTVAYQQEGSLTHLLTCDGSWAAVNETTQTVSSAAKIQRLKVSSATGRYVVELQEDFVLKSSEPSCVGTTQVAAVKTSCRYDDIWTYSHLPSSPRVLSPSWHAEGTDTGTQLALGLEQEERPIANLNFMKLRIDYVVGAPLTQGSGVIPFTGRMHFLEPERLDDIYSEDYFAGYCRGADSSAEGCCQFAPTEHRVTFRAASTQDGIPPIGNWRQLLYACNLQCSSNSTSGGGGSPGIQG